MDSASVPAARPRPIPLDRKDTQDGILSYYQSDEAGQVYTPPPLEIKTTVPKAHRRQMSAASSPSEYSPNTDEENGSKFFPPPPATTALAHKHKTSSSSALEGVRRRSSIPSAGGMDRRRLAIVDMSSNEHGHGAPRNGNIHSRRGIERPMDGLALVAPPDASPRTYTHLTPPASASLVVEKVHSSAPSRSLSHAKSSSEITTSGTAVLGTRSNSAQQIAHRRKSSRQVGIIGTSDAGADSPQRTPDALKSPIFQLPQLRAPSPPGTMSQSDISDAHGPSSLRGQSLNDRFLSTMNIIAPDPLVVTPGIGEGKDIHDPVAAPVVISLSHRSAPPMARPSRRSLSPGKLSARTSSPAAESISSSTAPSSSGSSYPSSPFSPEPQTAYLHYQPGVHAAAGPLPPPPRAVFNITPGTTPPPRPPRLNSPPPSGSRVRGDVGSVKQALQLPDAVGGVLNGKASSGSLSDVHSNSSRSAVSDRSEIILPRPRPMSAHSEELTPTATVIAANNTEHVREGAFPPSTETSPVMLRQGRSVDDSVADTSNTTDDPTKTNGVLLATVIESHRPSEKAEAQNVHGSKKDGGEYNIIVEDAPRAHSPPSDEGVAMSTDSAHKPRNLFRRSMSRSPPKVINDIGEDVTPPSPPRFRSTLGASLKRFSSLPRTPSRRSEKRSSGGSRSSNASSVSNPSILPPPSPPDVPDVPRSPPPIQKIISPWPSAMFYSEILEKKTALERSLAYAGKINELYMHDCGLGQFLMERHTGGNPSRKRAMVNSSGHRGPSTAPNSFQTRHISRSSMESEATFPRRADTTVATDLSYRPTVDTSPPNGPPPLPYPSLAQPLPSPVSQSSINMSLSSASSTRFLGSPRSIKSPGGFFSSLGRKASMRTKDSSDSSSSKLQKPSAKPAPPQPRPVDIPSAPTVPGGPRAAPNRVSRSQTIMLPKPPPSSASSRRSNSINQRPSTFARRPSPDATSGESVGNLKDDPEFVSQVDKLADLLPHADRGVLAGYLRRAGSDLNAIGQYLEDEKNGSLRLD